MYVLVCMFFVGVCCCLFFLPKLTGSTLAVFDGMMTTCMPTTLSLYPPGAPK